MELYDGTNTLVMTQTTDADGGYLFTMLIANVHPCVLIKRRCRMAWHGQAHAGQVPGADWQSGSPPVM